MGKAQIKHETLRENECVKRFAIAVDIAIFDALYFRHNHTRYVVQSQVHVLSLVSQSGTVQCQHKTASEAEVFRQLIHSCSAPF